MKVNLNLVNHIFFCYNIKKNYNYKLKNFKFKSCHLKKTEGHQGTKMKQSVSV